MNSFTLISYPRVEFSGLTDHWRYAVIMTPRVMTPRRWAQTVTKRRRCPWRCGVFGAKTGRWQSPPEAPRAVASTMVGTC